MVNRYSGLVDRGETIGYSPPLKARLLELSMANRNSGLVDHGETIGFSPQLEARLLELPLPTGIAG